MNINLYLGALVIALVTGEEINANELAVAKAAHITQPTWGAAAHAADPYTNPYSEEGHAMSSPLSRLGATLEQRQTIERVNAHLREQAAKLGRPDPTLPDHLVLPLLLAPRAASTFGTSNTEGLAAYAEALAPFVLDDIQREVEEQIARMPCDDCGEDDPASPCVYDEASGQVLCEVCACYARETRAIAPGYWRCHELATKVAKANEGKSEDEQREAMDEVGDAIRDWRQRGGM